MITVLKPGPLTTVQDTGRPGHRASGMPVAGAMDRCSLAAANLLAGNELGAAALELTLLGGVFRFEREGYSAIAGADMQAKLDGMPVSSGTSFAVRQGTLLTFGATRVGVRTYLAVRGGIDVPVVLGSRSTYVRARVGGFQGRALRAGDLVPVAGPAGPDPAPRSLLPSEAQADGGPVTLRAIAGPQDDRFLPEGLDVFFESAFRISVQNDRMGCRLDGTQVRLRGAADIITDALLPGAVQVTGNGMPIVMMMDCQTTGGYAKIATVIGPDLARLAQARVGEVVRFVRCTQAQAVEAVREERRALEALAKRLGAEAQS